MSRLLPELGHIRLFNALGLTLCATMVSACASPPNGEGPPLSTPPAVRFFPDLDVPYVPTPDSVIDIMLALTQPRPGELIMDLGCGDGRIVLSALNRVPGLIGFGVDLDPTRISQANAAALSFDLAERVTFVEQNLFDTDLSPANVMTLYLLPEVNVRLRPAIFDTLRPGTRIASHDFDMDDWPPETLMRVGRHRIYFWVVPVPMGGLWVVESQHPTLHGVTFDLVQGFQFVAGPGEAAPTDEPFFLRGRIDGDELDATIVPQGENDLRLRARFVPPDRIEGLIDLEPFSARRLSLEPTQLSRLDRDLPAQ